MTVRTSADGNILLEGSCPHEDAESLLQQLAATSNAVVDLRICDCAHTAVVQVLMAYSPSLLGPPRGELLRQWIYPQLLSHK